MRIVHLSDYYQPQVGYQEPNLAKAHAKKGHEVHVITSDRYFPFFNYEETFYPLLGPRIQKSGVFEENGIKVHRLPVWYEKESVGFIILKGISEKLKEIKPDIVFSHDILNISSYFTGKNKKKLRYKLIYDNHIAPFNSDMEGTTLKRWYLRFWKFVVRPQILKHADKVIAIGSAEKELAADFLDIYSDDVEIIELGADVERFRPNEKYRKEIREKLMVKDEEILIVHAGKFTPNKDIHVLLTGFSELVKEFSNIKLLLIGNGEKEYVRDLKEFIDEEGLQDKVIWKDFLPNYELARYFNAADIGTWPGNPSNVIQEAVASGLPVIIKSHPTTKFLLDNKNGFIINEEKFKESYMEALRKLISFPDLRKQMGALGREHALKRFSWETIGEKFLELIT